MAPRTQVKYLLIHLTSAVCQPPSWTLFADILRSGDSVPYFTEGKTEAQVKGQALSLAAC